MLLVTLVVVIIMIFYYSDKSEIRTEDMRILSWVHFPLVPKPIAA